MPYRHSRHTKHLWRKTMLWGVLIAALLGILLFVVLVE